MSKTFSAEDKAVLEALAITKEEVALLESLGVVSKESIKNIGSAEVLSNMSGIDTDRSNMLFAWAGIDAMSVGAAGQPAAAFDTTPVPFVVEEQSVYETWITAARQHNEVNEEYAEMLTEKYTALTEYLAESPDDVDAIYDFGRYLRIMLDPAVDMIYDATSISSEATSLIKAAEAFLVQALELYPTHGRARTMYGSLLCMQRRYEETVQVVTPALTLPEGSEDWMIAAHWYLAAKAALGDTYGESLEVYQKFRDHAVEGSNHQRFAEQSLSQHFE